MLMFRAIETHFVVSLILIGLAVGALPVLVQAQEREPQPGDYFWMEVVSGTSGALAGGVIIAYAGVAVVGYLYPCKNQTAFWGCLVGAVLVAEMAFLIGTPLGAATVVVMAGSSKRVRGNILLAFTGAIAGEAVGLVLGVPGFFSNFVLINPVILPVLAISTALGATFGYNLNATIEPVVLSPTNQGLVLVGLKARW